MNCKTCRFFYDSLTLRPPQGQCRYNPPTVAHPEGRAYWPSVEPQQWCGRYEKRHPDPKHPPTTPECPNHNEDWTP